MTKVVCYVAFKKPPLPSLLVVDDFWIFFCKSHCEYVYISKMDGLDDWSDDSLERLTPVMDENPKLHLKDALDIMAICNF